jgi:hypothetical protein
VTGEGKKETESWVAEKRAKYAYAYDKGGKLKSKLGVGGIPHAFLVNAAGKIVWDGHPGSLTDKEIQAAIDGALPTPLFDLPASATALKTALQKHNYAAALAEAGKLSEADGGPELLKIVQGIVTGRVQTMKGALEEGDFLTALDSATALKKELAGLPEAAEAEKVQGEIKSNKEADKIMDAQKKVRAIGDQRLGKRAEFEKALADLKKIAKDFPSTFVAKEADDLATQIEKKRAKK